MVYIGYYCPQVTSFRKLLTYKNKFDVIQKQKEVNSAPFVLIKIFGIITFVIFTITCGKYITTKFLRYVTFKILIWK